MKILIPHEEIVEICKNIGEQLSEKFKDKNPIVVCVLKGSAPFHSELVKHMNIDLEVDYIQVSSYKGTQSTGNVVFKKDLETNIINRDVIIVEDIVDSGRTLKELKINLVQRKPSSLTFVTLLDKPSGRCG